MLSSMLLYSLLVIFLFAFAFDPLKVPLAQVFPGIFWMGNYFAALLGLGRTFAVEREGEAFLGLLLAPVDRGAIFLGKFLANLLLLLAMEIVALPLYVGVFNFPWQGNPLWVLAVLLLGSAGFTATGTLFAGMVGQTRMREMLLPLVLLPISVPEVIGTVEATRSIFAGHPAGAALWLELLAVYDLVFLILPFLLFEFMVEV